MKRIREPIKPECLECIWLEDTGGTTWYCPFSICKYDKNYRFKRSMSLESFRSDIQEAYQEHRNHLWGEVLLQG